jgi:uncharacterized membrane protein
MRDTMRNNESNNETITTIKKKGFEECQVAPGVKCQFTSVVKMAYDKLYPHFCNLL